MGASFHVASMLFLGEGQHCHRIIACAFFIWGVQGYCYGDFWEDMTASFRMLYGQYLHQIETLSKGPERAQRKETHIQLKQRLELIRGSSTTPLYTTPPRG